MQPAVLIILVLTVSVHCKPGWFGKEKGPEYEINPNFGFRSYHQIRYEPMSVPMDEPGYGDQGGQEMGYGADGGYGPGDMGLGGGDMGQGPYGQEMGYGGPGGDGGYGAGPDMSPDIGGGTY